VSVDLAGCLEGDGKKIPEPGRGSLRPWSLGAALCGLTHPKDLPPSSGKQTALPNSSLDTAIDMEDILPFDDRLTRLKSRGPTLGRLLHPVRSAVMTDSSIPFGDPDLFTPMCVYTLRCRGSVTFRFVFLLAEAYQRQILYCERRSQRERRNMNPVPTKQCLHSYPGLQSHLS
jgi:hypothetical protein